MKNDEFPIQPYTIKQLAASYNCSTWTFRKWLTKIQPMIGERVGHFYTPSQVRIIVGHLGAPFITFFTACAGVLVSVAEVCFGEDYVGTYQAGSEDENDKSSHSHILEGTDPWSMDDNHPDAALPDLDVIDGDGSAGFMIV